MKLCEKINLSLSELGNHNKMSGQKTGMDSTLRLIVPLADTLP